MRLKVVTASTPAVQQSRLQRCDALSSVWHPHLLTPIDYGPLGQARWFEAWSVWSADLQTPAWRTAGALRAAVSFLHSNHLSAGRASLHRAGQCNGEVVLAPDEHTGGALVTDHAVGAEAEAWRILLKRWPDLPAERVVGFRLEVPAAVKWVTDVLDDAKPGDVRIVGIRGRGWSTFRLMVARAARARGFVPVDLRLLNRWTRLIAELRDRHLMLLADQHPAIASVGGLLGHGLHSPNACVVVRRVTTSREADRGLSEDGTVSLGSLPAERLAGLATIYPPNALTRAEVLDHARRADGCPHRFAELVSCHGEKAAPVASSRPWVVREARLSHDGGSAPAPEPVRIPAAAAFRPDPAASRARRCAERAAVLMTRGRHAAAERWLRRAIGALERRGLRVEAAVGRLDLAEHLARRGRVEEALNLLARQPPDDLRTRVRAAIRIASLLTDQARLIEAESSARWARLAAGDSGGGSLAAEAAVALARSLFWQGRLDEAASCLPIERADGNALDVHVCAERARIALAQTDLASAGRAAAASVRAAAAYGNTSGEVTAHLSMAVVQASIGDEPGFRQHAQKAGEAARRARSPLDRVRVQLAHGEGALTLGLGSELRAVDRSLQRWERRALPALLRIRVQHLRGRLGHRDSAATSRRAAEAWQIGMLLRPSGSEGRRMDALQELAEILQICHESPDERTALTRTCTMLRDRLRARSVGIVGREGGAIAGAGHGWGVRSALVDRVVATGQASGPTLEDAGLEAAAPVRYAGRTIAVLGGRWPVDCLLDQSQVLGLLAAAAAASAPSARALFDRAATSGAGSPASVPALLGTSHAVELVRQAALRAARAPFSVLVEGESGSGKELVARAIHTFSDRRDRRFCTVNCAAFADDLLEAELFGHARGAFTGAVAERPGLFEDADQGTLLLDELSELSPRAQAKLLRVLQDGEVRRVGENLPRRVDVRIIGASNRSLAQEVASGRFRADLRYRLDVIRIVVPPLRERVEDIPLLAAHFWDQATRRTHSRATLDPDTLATLARYDWPGNVRELQNVMTALAVQAGPRGRIGADALPDHLSRATGPSEPATLEQARESFERRFVRATLARVGGHRGRAAQALGLTRQGLAKLLKRLEIERPDATADQSARAVS